MKNRLNQTMKTMVFAALALVALPALSHAQLLVYSDDFGGSAATLAGRTPTLTNGFVATGYAGGSASPTWASSGFATLGNVADRAGYAGSSHASLSFTPQSFEIYTLTATLSPALLGSMTLGFLNSSGTYTDSALLRGSAVTGNGAKPQLNGISFGDNTSEKGTQTVVLTLNTMGPEWTTSVTINGTTADFTYLSNPSIAEVGFSGTGLLGAGVKSFSLVALPEPSSYLMGLIVLGLLAFEIRRRKTATVPA